MALRDELEQALLASWDTAALAVYADHLLALGDPRGELIALDLAPRRESAWHERRHAALQAWLGEPLAASAGRLVRHGFIHELRDGHHPPGLLEGPLGAVVRGFSIRDGRRGAPPDAVLGALERLAAHPRPWLTRLAIDHTGDVRCNPALRDRLIAATPNLVELYTLGERLFDSFRHPSLRRLYATPRRQRPAPGFRGVPETGAEVIELAHHDHVVRRFARGNGLDAALTFLEAIEATADCNELEAIYGGLVEEPDSMAAVLMRLDEAGLVELDGPFANPTALGRGLMRGSVERPRRRGPREAGFSPKWILCAADAAARPLGRDETVIGITLHHHRLLCACLERIPLEETARAVIHEYLESLWQVVGADDDHPYVELDVDLPALGAALRRVVAARRLTDYGIDYLEVPSNEREWEFLEDLVRFLEALPAGSGRALFRVTWGW